MSGMDVDSVIQKAKKHNTETQEEIISVVHEKRMVWSDGSQETLASFLPSQTNTKKICTVS